MQDVCDVFEPEGPGRAIEREHLGPAPNVHGSWNRDQSKAIPPLYGALLKNEQDVQLLERLAFMHRREAR